MELLSPAGSREALEAAVQSGADAVYMGFGAFNARRSAKNFTDDDFAAATAKFARKVGAKQIVTQLFNRESGGPDAFAQSLHSLVPTVPISMVSVSGKIYHIYPNYRTGVFHKTPSAG